MIIFGPLWLVAIIWFVYWLIKKGTEPKRWYCTFCRQPIPRLTPVCPNCRRHLVWDPTETIELDVLRTLNTEQRAYFQAQYNKVRKSTTTCLILAFFLGGLGAHHFYLGKILLGILYAIFVWTLIPSLIALFELFFIKKRVNRWNESKAKEIAAQVTFLHQALPTAV